jgi:hypothetical protein
LQAEQEKEVPMVIDEEPEEREISKKRNRKGSNSTTNRKTEELIIEVEKQPGPLAAEKKSESKPMIIYSKTQPICLSG